MASRQTWTVGASASRRMWFDPGELWDNLLQHARWGLRQLVLTPAFSTPLVKIQDRSSSKGGDFCHAKGSARTSKTAWARPVIHQVQCSVLFLKQEKGLFYVRAQNCPRECSPWGVGKANRHWAFSICEGTGLRLPGYSTARCSTAASRPLSRGKQAMIWSGSNVFRGGASFSSREMNSESLLV